jgi:hypothetical protein
LAFHRISIADSRSILHTTFSTLSEATRLSLTILKRATYALDSMKFSYSKRLWRARAKPG